MAIGCCIRRTLKLNMKKGLFILTLFFNVKIYSQATGSTTTGYGILKYQLFSTSSTWVSPAGVPFVSAYCWGGGGAGGSSQNSGGNAGGGAGGQFVRKDNFVVSQQQYTVTVAAAQTTSGFDGDISYFGNVTIVVAQGGRAGINSTGTATAGGTGSTQSAIGDYIVAGGSGASGASAGGGGGGGGGNTGSGNNASGSSGGSGGTGVNGGAGGAGGNGAASAGAGNTGTEPGGGGGGAKSNNGILWNGGGGGAGRVVVEWRTTHLMFF